MSDEKDKHVSFTPEEIRQALRNVANVIQSPNNNTNDNKDNHSHTESDDDTNSETDSHDTSTTDDDSDDELQTTDERINRWNAYNQLLRAHIKLCDAYLDLIDDE